MRRLVLSVALLGAAILLVACSFDKRPDPTPAPTTVARVKASLKVEGKILFVRAGNIWMWDNGSLKEVTKGGHDTQPNWASDGTAFAYVNREESRSNIMMANAANGSVRSLTNTRYWGSYSGWVYRPTWSPDNKKIAYLSDEGSYDLALWMMNWDGTGRTKVAYTAQTMGGIDSPSWSPDGKQIAMTAYRTLQSQVWSVTLANGRWQQLTKAEHGAYDPSWSPAGDKIASVVRDGDRNYVWIMDASGENPRQLTSDGAARAPTWSYDGQYLAYVSSAGGSGFDIWVMKVEVTDGEVVTSEPKQLTKGLDVDPGAGLSWLK